MGGSPQPGWIRRPQQAVPGRGGPACARQRARSIREAAVCAGQRRITTLDFRIGKALNRTPAKSILSTRLGAAPDSHQLEPITKQPTNGECNETQPLSFDQDLVMDQRLSA